AQGWNGAVLLRAQARKPRLARVNHEGVRGRPVCWMAVGATTRNSSDEHAHELVAVGLIYAYAVLDRNGYRNRLTHGNHTLRHQLRLCHKARPERTALHPV